MPTFAMLTRLAPAAARSPAALENLERKAMAAVRESCAGVVWLGSFAVLGPYDYLDIFETPDLETATKVSTLIRTFGHAQTETWPVTAWPRYKEIVRDLPETAAAEDQTDAPEGALLERMLFPMDTQNDLPLSADEVAAFVDDDAEAVAAILALDPSREEFATAVAWAENEDEEYLSQGGLPLQGKVLAIYNILTADEEWLKETAAGR